MRSVIAVMLALCVGGCCGEDPDHVPELSSGPMDRPQRACTKANLDASVTAYKDALMRMNDALDNLGVGDTKTQRRARGYIRAVCVEGRKLDPPEGTDGELLCMNSRVARAYYNAYRRHDEMVMRCAAARSAR